jgi:hypothetical protein
MRYLPAEVVPLPRRGPMRIECVQPDAANRHLLTDVPSTPPEMRRLTDLHWKGAGDFLVDSRIGFVLDRDHVAGPQLGVGKA